MPRNSSGVYSLPVAAFVPGTTIVASQVNANFSDIATALTLSLATTGVSTMTGPIKAAAGTVGAPSYTFAADQDTGRYYVGTNAFTDVVNGTALVEYTTSGINVLGAIKKNNVEVESFPSAQSLLSHNSAAPTGWTVDVTNTNKGLRLSNTALGTGGTRSFTNTFASRFILQANLPNVNFVASSLIFSLNPDGTIARRQFGAFNSGGTAAVESSPGIGFSSSITGFVPSGGSGTGLDFDLEYVDINFIVKS